MFRSYTRWPEGAAHPQSYDLRREERIPIVGVGAVEGGAGQVGSGSHGLVFSFGTGRVVGCDPLAVEYAGLFPAWQPNAPTVAARGEALPFADGTFDVVLCDNVVDHAADPAAIAGELVGCSGRKGGSSSRSTCIIRFTRWRTPLLGLARLQSRVTPFADHTVHLTWAGARRLFAGRPLRVISEGGGSAGAGARRRGACGGAARSQAPRGRSAEGCVLQERAVRAGGRARGAARPWTRLMWRVLVLW